MKYSVERLAYRTNQQTKNSKRKMKNHNSKFKTVLATQYPVIPVNVATQHAVLDQRD